MLFIDKDAESIYNKFITLVRTYELNYLSHQKESHYTF